MNAKPVLNLGYLSEQIDRYYHPDDLRLLCDDLGVDYDQIPGSTKQIKVGTLVWQCGRSDRLRELLIGLGNQREDISWPEAPELAHKNGNGHRANGVVHEPRSNLRNYLEELKIRLQRLNLLISEPGSETRLSATDMILDTLNRLDLRSKRELLQYLWQSKLIDRNDPIINLDGADFSRVDLSWMNLSQANLSRINLAGADLALVDLHDSDLSGARLRGAIMRSYLSGADLTGSDLRECDLSDAKVAGAKLTGASLRIARLNRTDFSGANLVGADMFLSNLQEANLMGSLLQWTNLQMTNLRQSNLAGADLSGSDLTGAEITLEQLQVAANAEYAVLPDKFIIVYKKTADKPVSDTTQGDNSVKQNKNGFKPAIPVNGGRGRLLSAATQLFHLRI